MSGSFSDALPKHTPMLLPCTDLLRARAYQSNKAVWKTLEPESDSFPKQSYSQAGEPSNTQSPSFQLNLRYLVLQHSTEPHPTHPT